MLARSSKESLGLVAMSVSTAGFLAWISPQLLEGGLGLLLLLSGLVGALLTIFVNIRDGSSVIGSMIAITIVGALGFVGSYGVMWYFMVHLASQPNLMPFSR